MSYTGHVKEGVVVFDGQLRPPAGATVQVVELTIETQEPPTWGEVFKNLIGTADGLPEDMAENLDHYIHGATKR